MFALIVRTGHELTRDARLVGGRAGPSAADVSRKSTAVSSIPSDGNLYALQ